MPPSRTRWYVTVSWLRSSDQPWRLTQFVPNADEALDFQVIPADYSVDRSQKNTGMHDWRALMRHGGKAWRTATETRGPCGIVTAFPQLAVAVGLRKRLARSDIPVLAWTFNLGRVPPGVRQHLSRLALGRINRFIVHSRAEIAAYSQWLDIAPERFTFLPFETRVRPIEFPEDSERPFVVSLGSAKRDYRLLFAVLAELGYPAVIVAAQHAVAGLTIPPSVTVRSGLTGQECFELMQRSRYVVVPVANRTTASGQVTMLDAMMFGRPVIITDCPASVDYVSNGVDGLLVRQGDHDDLKSAMQRLWEDEPLRKTIGSEARTRAEQSFSEQVIATEMGRILRELSCAG